MGSMMDTNLLQVTHFDGRQSPMEIKPDTTTLLNTINSFHMLSQSSTSASSLPGRGPSPIEMKPDTTTLLTAMNSFPMMSHTSTSAERILEAERICERLEREQLTNEGEDIQAQLRFAAKKQLTSLVEWAKHIPHFTELCLDDQVALLREGWNELMIAGFSHRSIGIQNGIQLASGVVVTKENAHTSGLGAIFDSVMALVSKMRKMCMDKTELGSLRAMVLFNPDVKGLKDVDRVEQLKEMLYVSLDEYTRSNNEDELRSANLMLRLPGLRSIALKCKEHLFYFNIIGESGHGLDSLLLECLQGDNEKQQEGDNEKQKEGDKEKQQQEDKVFIFI